MPDDLVFALAFLATGAGIVFWQRRARNCRAHSAVAGALAWVLAGLCFAAAGLMAVGAP